MDITSFEFDSWGIDALHELLMNDFPFTYDVGLYFGDDDDVVQDISAAISEAIGPGALRYKDETKETIIYNSLGRWAIFGGYVFTKKESDAVLIKLIR